MLLIVLILNKIYVLCTVLNNEEPEQREENVFHFRVDFPCECGFFVFPQDIAKRLPKLMVLDKSVLYKPDKQLMDFQQNTSQTSNESLEVTNYSLENKSTMTKNLLRLQSERPSSAGHQRCEENHCQPGNFAVHSQETENNQTKLITEDSHSVKPESDPLLKENPRNTRTDNFQLKDQNLCDNPVQQKLTATVELQRLPVSFPRHIHEKYQCIFDLYERKTSYRYVNPTHLPDSQVKNHIFRLKYKKDTDEQIIKRKLMKFLIEQRARRHSTRNEDMLPHIVNVIFDAFRGDSFKIYTFAAYVLFSTSGLRTLFQSVRDENEFTLLHRYRCDRPFTEETLRKTAEEWDSFIFDCETLKEIYDALVLIGKIFLFNDYSFRSDRFVFSFKQNILKALESFFETE